MKKILLALLISLSFMQSVSSRQFKLKARHYYSLLSDMETRVTKWDGTNLSLEVFEIEKPELTNYRIGTTLLGHVIKNKKAKRFYRDQYLMVQIDEAHFPDGHIEAEDMKIKIHPRAFLFNKERVGVGLVDAVAFTLGTIFDSTVVGLPISRGGYAVLYSALEIQKRPLDVSRWRAGLVGFSKGIIFPIPQMLAKGHNLDKMQPGARLSLDREKRGKSIDAYLRA